MSHATGPIKKESFKEEKKAISKEMLAPLTELGIVNRAKSAVEVGSLL